MPGLIQAAQEKPEAPQAAAPEQPENENRLRIVLAAMNILYEKQTSDGVIKMLRSGPPAQALAQTVLFVTKALYDKSQNMPTQELAPAAQQITQLAAELGKAAGVQLDDQAIAQADQLVQQSLNKRFPPQAAPAPEEAAEAVEEAPAEEAVEEEE